MISYFWYRRDLRLDDNHGLSAITEKYKNVVPIFIFDTEILEELPKDDKRVSFIYLSLKKLGLHLNLIDLTNFGYVNNFIKKNIGNKKLPP